MKAKGNCEVDKCRCPHTRMGCREDAMRNFWECDGHGVYEYKCDRGRDARMNANFGKSSR